MKKRKTIKICLALSAFASITYLSSNFMMKTENNISRNTEIALVDPTSAEFKDAIDMSLKEKYGDNYKEVITKNAQAVNMARQFNSKVKNKVTNEIQYPSDFGGMYINDNQELVIQMVNNSKEKSVIKPLASSISNDIIYEYVDNSYEDLENVNDRIIKYFSNENIVNDILSANYIDVINNTVIVELKNNTIEEQEWFKKNVVNSNLIKFIKGDSISKETATYNAGGASSVCSIGYRAKLNGKEGYVTAGHCVKLNQDISGYGKVTARAYVPAEGIDGAFVQLYSGNSITNNIQWGYSNVTHIDTNNSIPITGTIIAKSGKSTHATSGAVLFPNFSYTDSESKVYYSRLIHASAQCFEGDSGGVVYTFGVTNTGTVVGIVQGKNVTNGGPASQGNLLFSRSDWIDNNLGITRY